MIYQDIMMTTHVTTFSTKVLLCIPEQTGITMSAEIFHVNLQIITVQQCMNVFGPTFVQQSTLCTSGAGGVGICGGDSGGPLVVTQFGQRVLVREKHRNRYCYVSQSNFINNSASGASRKYLNFAVYMSNLMSH